MTARKPIRRMRRKPPTESSLSILIPVGIERIGKGYFRRFVAAMRADNGKLVIDAAGTRLCISGIELHTALHALGFVRLNDRDGYG